MQQRFELGGLSITAQADSVREARDYVILEGPRAELDFPVPPRLFYRFGWQSWSLTAWTPLTSLPLQKPVILHPMQTDPVYVHEKSPNGSWLGALELENGSVLLLGALGTDAHVVLEDGRLVGTYEAGSGEWLVAVGDKKSVFADYADSLGERLGKTGAGTAPRVWCSWYSLYTAIDEQVLERIIGELESFPFDVIQVDDGWQVRIGEWEANKKFPSGMQALAAKIKSTGRKAGLWLAPLIAVKSSRLFREHPDWFLRDARGRHVSAGFNWTEPLFALDTTHPDALEWLTGLMKRARGWGFDYLKLDFLYAGALPGKRHTDMPREAAYRTALQAMREAMGADAYLLACGAPIIPSLGICDALRIGPDVAGVWEKARDARQLHNPAMPGAKNAVRTTVNGLWLSDVVQVDPDVVYFRSQECDLRREEKLLLQDLALVCKFKTTSDPPQLLTQLESEELRTFLAESPKIAQLGDARYRIGKREVDFGPALSLPEPATGFDALVGRVVGWAASQPLILKVDHQLSKRPHEKLRRDLRDRS